MIRAIAIALLLLFAGSASAQTVRFPSVAVGNSAAGPEISGWMYKPSGAGPFPGIVLAHTCGGVSPHTEVWGKLLASWGYVVVAPIPSRRAARSRSAAVATSSTATCAWPTWRARSTSSTPSRSCARARSA